MITAAEIRKILDSPEYRRDLEELSSYAANIKQERPMVLFLSKYLYLRDHKLALEQDGHDLVVDGTSIDFKFHYDFDISHKLQRELTNHAGSIQRIWKAANAGKLSWTWTVVPGIYKDVCVKSPDIFVWVICARDLSGMNDDDLNRICLGSWQRKYNTYKPCDSSLDCLALVDSFLEKLRKHRRFAINKITIATRGIFPSSYHVRVCDFKGD